MQRKTPYWRSLTFCLCIFVTGNIFAQTASDSINYPLRKKIVIGGNAVAYSATMFGLYHLWYKGYPLSSFHFFNDNQEWNQMDKVGHAFSCYYEGVVGIKMMEYAGFTHKQASIYGGAYGFFIQSGVEIFDGFSEGWGASVGDIAANTFGSGLAISQSLLWNEQRVWMKYSYTPSNYAKLRPNVLGSNLPERILKDYNAQTYWLSANINSFASDSKWPSWLNIALGYSADGMVGGHDNIFESNGVTYDYSNIIRGRQFYLSPDIDLTKIKTKKKFVRTLLIMANSLKVPLPTLEYHTEDGFKGHWIKF
ncbi:MAG: YfiM family protein [Bacteroidia bacterium]|nr:YfiM family protein [Bacteroidia bacterium]NNJ56121.1 DUF2279 domain-containing protein [Bacteroidia bacterium]